MRRHFQLLLLRPQSVYFNSPASNKRFCSYKQKTLFNLLYPILRILRNQIIHFLLKFTPRKLNRTHTQNYKILYKIYIMNHEKQLKFEDNR